MIGLALQHWAPLLSGYKVIALTDNTATQAHLDRLRAPNKIVVVILRQLAHVAIKHNIAVVANHIAGRINNMADVISKLDKPGNISRFIGLVHQYHSLVAVPVPAYYNHQHHVSNNS